VKILVTLIIKLAAAGTIGVALFASTVSP